METKKALAFVAMALVFVSAFSLLTAPTKATPDVPALPTIDASNAQVCATVDTNVSALPTPLPSGSPLSSGSAYDEQLGLTLVQSFTAITYYVIAVAQHDTIHDQYGPAYLVNGLTNVGYWYQTGLAYYWPSAGGYASGFRFAYEVYAPNGTSIFPSGGGGGLSSFNGTVNAADLIIISLYFSSQNVTMSASDYNTGAYASQTYSAENAAYFEGLPNGEPVNGVFSGLMTEWYHSEYYAGNEAQVTYYGSAPISSAGMWMDELDPSGRTLWANATGALSPPHRTYSNFLMTTLQNTAM
jgi:hypothetical protein